MANFLLSYPNSRTKQFTQGPLSLNQSILQTFLYMGFLRRALFSLHIDREEEGGSPRREGKKGDRFHSDREDESIPGDLVTSRRQSGNRIRDWSKNFGID
ncbi:hypothetical protein TNIN_180581 [Trichonephila inaurata madagascariensis]|uniref:Uncharacterized protein n=1 Tax=Trichonephila inaurata madagascariensis TaxID=2747483 RepID=A0A8X6X2Y7_9ARAC|nr:hypothetical protein TNIN_180581 [Trichonephila inaurata madagascariensis]